MLIFDYSQIAYALVYALKKDILESTDEGITNIIRSGVLSSIRHKKRKFKASSEDVVIACDGNSYWRYDFFPQYKCGRKAARDKDDMPWDVIKKSMEQVRLELSQVLPYPVIYHEKAEADDVIAILVEDVVNRRPYMTGLEESFEDVVLINKDKDCSQLLKYSHVKQYSPYTDTFLKLECTPKEFLRRLILTGDSGDSIPNVFSPADCFVTKTRQSPATEKKMASFLLAENMLDVADETTKERLITNTRLISFNAIPKQIRREVVELYDAPIPGNKMALFAYLSKHRCQMNLDRFEEF